MNNEKNVYITFPKGEALSGWISDFLIHFKTTLSRLINSDLQYFIKESDFSSNNYDEYIKQTDIFIVILGTTSDDEAEFREELAEIYASLDIENKSLTELSRLFKVCISPENKAHSDENILKIQAYNFFEVIQRRNATPKTLTFQSESNKAWARLLDLAYDIKDTLELSPSSRQIENRRFVYLGHSSPDITFARDDIKREIQHFGYRILPLTDLPENEAQLQEIIPEYLKNCDHIIQIIGSKYGTIAPGEKYSLFEIENRLIRKFLEENGSRKRHIWVPNNIKINDQKQELFLNRLRRDDASDQTEIVEVGQEDFKNIVSNVFLRDSDSGITERQKGGVYIIKQLGDVIDDLMETAGSLNVNILVNESGNKGYYSRHLQLLKAADCVLIIWNNADQTWVKSILKDVIKSVGLGKLNQFLAIGIIADEMPDITEIESWLPKIFHLKRQDMDNISDFFSIAKA